MNPIWSLFEGKGPKFSNLLKKERSREEKVAQVAQTFARHFIPATFSAFKVDQN